MKALAGVLFLTLAARSVAQAPSPESILIGDFGEVRLFLGESKDSADSSTAGSVQPNQARVPQTRRPRPYMMADGDAPCSVVAAGDADAAARRREKARRAALARWAGRPLQELGECLV